MEPDDPVGPEAPEPEDGLAMAVEVALPVSPELVALEDDWAAPVPPLVAVGVTAAVEAPPSPPSLDPSAMVAPPMAAASGPTELIPAVGAGDEVAPGLPISPDPPEVSAGMSTARTAAGAESVGEIDRMPSPDAGPATS